MYVIPEEIKEELRRVVGKLVTLDDELIAELKARKGIIAVGDMVTYTLIRRGIEIDIAVVDFRHRRGRIPDEMRREIEMFGDRIMEVENPPSVITDELMRGLREACKLIGRKRVLVKVDGEEDLASLVAILHAPKGATVIYGLPDKGVVILEVGDKEKEMVKKLLERCRAHGAGDNR
ncbi:MAG: DUF359 domain-containing protein [Thermoplasmata archaeon]|nr:MAG: DUF359 domain-containing protein [Thermoplasmata archaeon]